MATVFQFQHPIPSDHRHFVRSQSKGTSPVLLPHNFDGGLLQIAREASGLNRIELAKLVATSPSFITACEKGRKKPSPSLIELLATTLGVEEGFFALSSEGWDLDSCHFRHRQAATLTELGTFRSELYLFSRLGEVLHQYVEFPEVRLLRDLDISSVSVDEVATALRSSLGLSANSPIGPLVRVIENAGILVAFSSLEGSRVDACSIYGQIPIILASPSGRSGCRLRFDLAHELGELVFSGRAKEVGLAHERNIDRFAASFLMPPISFRAHFASKLLSISHLIDLKRTWGTSISAILKHAQELRILSDADYVFWKRKTNARGWARSEPYDTEIDSPELLPRAFRMAFKIVGSMNQLCMESRIQEKLVNRLLFQNVGTTNGSESRGEEFRVL